MEIVFGERKEGGRMKSARSVILVMCVVLCLNIVEAQDFSWPSGRAFTDRYPQEFWNWWEKVWTEYMARKQAFWQSYSQAWNENMQNGIKRLNTMPLQEGITPINGALLIDETDVSIPGRRGNGILVTRFYNSKIWAGDTSDGQVNSTLESSSWMGTGWDMHFGRLYAPDDSCKILQTADGKYIYFKRHAWPFQQTYISTDGSFMVLQDDTVRIGDGTRLIFDFASGDYYYLTKIIDHNGNATNFFYNSSTYFLDSLKTSTSEKVNFYVNGVNNVLDSIKYIAFDNNTVKISYSYYVRNIESSPFGAYSGASFLLKWVLFPNGDTIKYDYNQYFELKEIRTTGGGLIKYEYKTDTFYIPERSVMPPFDTCRALLQLTRGITKAKSYDQWTAPDTNITQYERVFTRLTQNRAVSNADSVKIVYPEGNRKLLFYRASYDSVGRAEITQWRWENGRLDSVKFYDKYSVFLKKENTYEECVTADSIPMPSYVQIYNGAKSYQTKYYDYDEYGHARLIHEYGDTDIDTDDQYIHHEYAYGDTTFWLETDAGPSSPPTTSYTTFFSLTGVDTLTIHRSWGNNAGGPWYSPEETTFTYAGIHKHTESLSITHPSYQYARVEAWAKEYESGHSLHVWAVWDLHDIPDLSNDSAFAYKTDYSGKYIINLVKQVRITSDSLGDSLLAKTKYFYDDTCYIETTYASLDQWETPPDPPDVRGNLTRVEQWNAGNNYAKNELRYDNVGNVIMTISHSTVSRAETTFTYYNSAYQYAFPWRTVTHPSASDSLCSRIEYDIHTGLVTKEIDESNSDSTCYIYDNMNRLTTVYLPNESQLSTRINYKDQDNPKSVVDSTRLDFDGEQTRWIVTKGFYDGFGRLIQTKRFDNDNSRTIVRNTSYNGNGLVDSLSMPYETSGTSMSYSSPDWNKPLTQYQYASFNRITRITHPDGENIDVKHYANTDTIFDEKGNKTINIYNAYGTIDTLIDAYGNIALYKYDRLGRLTQIVDAENKESDCYYDPLGRLVAMNGPDAKSSFLLGTDSVDVLYSYDDANNLILKRDAHGFTRYTYDNVGRFTRVEFSTDSSYWTDKVRCTYDVLAGLAPTELQNPKGRLSKLVTCGVDSQTFFYDDRGRLGLKRINIVGLTGEKTINYRFNYADLCTLMNVSSPSSYKTIYKYNRLGQIKSIPDLVNTFRYNPVGQVTKINHANGIIDTITYDNTLRPIQIRAFKTQDILKLAYYYEENSNVDSIADYINTTYSQGFTYDSLNRLITVTSSAGNQSFTYDKVGNRRSKNGTNYSYFTNTNRLQQDHRGYTYSYDDNGNIISRSDGASYQYDWNNRLTEYTTSAEEIDFAYNASGLRVKKHYHIVEEPKGGGESGFYFSDPSDDMGMTSSGGDTVYNKGRDIEKIFAKDSAGYLTFVVVNRHLFSGDSRQKLFITIDIDTIVNSGRITLPEDTLTKVMAKCAWEYCIYVEDNDYGIYRQDGTKLSLPFGMLVQRITGDSGFMKIKVSKMIINMPQAIRYTITTFDPDISTNPDSLWQGGSIAADVFPGTHETFGGEINGYGEIMSNGLDVIKEYTIYYVYDGINPIVEYSPNGSILARYVYARDLHIAKITGADTNWYHCNALGSPRKMTDERGDAVWTATYYPFGEMTAGSNNTHGFAGKEYDSEMGLNYFCQRYYDPQIGRFMTLDPFGDYTTRSQTQNRYVYCINNPLKYTDPLGLDMQPYIPDPDEDYDEWWWPIGTIIPVEGTTVWGNPDPFYSDDPYDVFYGSDPTRNYSDGLHPVRGWYRSGSTNGVRHTPSWDWPNVPHPTLPNVPLPDRMGIQIQAGGTLLYGGESGVSWILGEGFDSFVEVNTGGLLGWSIGVFFVYGPKVDFSTYNVVTVSAFNYTVSYYYTVSNRAFYVGYGTGTPGFTMGQVISTPIWP
jgi:RHS repeat-associated protein